MISKTEEVLKQHILLVNQETKLGDMFVSVYVQSALSTLLRSCWAYFKLKKSQCSIANVRTGIQ